MEKDKAGFDGFKDSLLININVFGDYLSWKNFGLEKLSNYQIELTNYEILK